jgi:hypothetical protein
LITVSGPNNKHTLREVECAPDEIQSVYQTIKCSVALHWWDIRFFIPTEDQRLKEFENMTVVRIYGGEGGYKYTK